MNQPFSVRRNPRGIIITMHQRNGEPDRVLAMETLPPGIVRTANDLASYFGAYAMLMANSVRRSRHGTKKEQADCISLVRALVEKIHQEVGSHPPFN